MLVTFRVFSERRELTFRLNRFKARMLCVDEPNTLFPIYRDFFIRLEYGSRDYADFVRLICELDMDCYEADEDELFDYGFPLQEEEDFLPLLCSLLESKS